MCHCHALQPMLVGDYTTPRTVGGQLDPLLQPNRAYLVSESSPKIPIASHPVHGSGLAVILNQPAQPATKQVERFETHVFDGFRRIAMHVCRSSEALG